MGRIEEEGCIARLRQRVKEFSNRHEYSFDVQSIAFLLTALDEARAEIRRLEEMCESLHGLDACTLYQQLKQAQRENERLQAWVNDLHTGMYINCVYCGHRYGPDTEVPASMADVLKEHIEQCPKHPLSHAKKEIEQLKQDLAQERHRAAEMVRNQAEHFGDVWQLANDVVAQLHNLAAEIEGEKDEGN